jgi:hypothetical protein
MVRRDNYKMGFSLKTLPNPRALSLSSVYICVQREGQKMKRKKIFSWVLMVAYRG